MSDLISRCELFNRLAPVQTLGEAYGIIQEMPTVDAVPVRHGKWLEDPDDDWGCRCSECGHLELYQFDYCSSCGARMDGKGNGNG